MISITIIHGTVLAMDPGEDQSGVITFLAPNSSTSTKKGIDDRILDIKTQLIEHSQCSNCKKNTCHTHRIKVPRAPPSIGIP